MTPQLGPFSRVNDGKRTLVDARSLSLTVTPYELKATRESEELLSVDFPAYCLDVGVARECADVLYQ